MDINANHSRFVIRRVFVVGAVAVLVAASWGLEACKKRSGDDIPSTTSAYSVVEVQNGGTISGTVTIEGGAPAVPVLEINHDNDACGSSHASPRMVCNPSGAVKYAVVHLVDIKSGAGQPVPKEPFLLVQKGCAYEPHVAIVPVGSMLAVQNLDKNVLHNVHMLHGDATVWNQAQPMFEQTNQTKLSVPGFMTLRCDAGHIWMSGYVVVTEHPYYAVTDENGHFSIANVPPGTYTVECWHEGWNTTEHRADNGELTGYSYDGDHVVRQQATVQPGAVTTMSFAIPAK